MNNRLDTTKGNPIRDWSGRRAADNRSTSIADRARDVEKSHDWVGDAWFDETARAVRLDAPRRERMPFDPDEFERMSPEQADEYERRVLAACCPEVGLHRDGRPDYARHALFTCPQWLRQPTSAPG